MRISDWSSDVCSSDLVRSLLERRNDLIDIVEKCGAQCLIGGVGCQCFGGRKPGSHELANAVRRVIECGFRVVQPFCPRSKSEEHTSELQSLMRSSYAVFCLKKKKRQRPRLAYSQSRPTPARHCLHKRENGSMAH